MLVKYKLHPNASVQIEMGLLPLKWVAKKRCVEFRHKVMTMAEERLVKRVAMEALSLKGKSGSGGRIWSDVLWTLDGVM